jgi:perosamine synthetase
VFVVRLADTFGRQDRDAVLAGLRARGVACRNYFVPIHLQPFIQERLGTREGQFPVTEQVAMRSIALPFHNRLTESEVARVVAALKESVAALRVGRPA